ncbi:hypothetical protein ACFL2V_10005 [Pseudomonadota bacterium]
MKTLKSFFLTLPIIFSLVAIQQANAADNSTQINAIISETGFDELLEHVPEFAQNILKQSSGALDPKVNSSMSLAFKQAFAVSRVRSDVYNVINSHFDSAQANAYLNQLQSPMVRRISELEGSTNEPANREAFIAFAQSLKKSPARAGRQALIDRLDKATRITEFGVDMQAAFFKAVFTAVNPVLDDDMRVGSDEMEKMVNEVRNSFSDAYKENTRTSYLFSFRDLSDAELEAYIKLCESSDYRWGVQLLGNAMISALNQAADRAALYMAQANQ